MKIIFLDIDGVLNHIGMNDPIKNEYKASVSKSCVERLNQLTDKTEAKIVISSSWRGVENKNMKQCDEQLYDFGVTGDIIGETPRLNYPSSFRGNEIYCWMQKGGKNCTEYVILDDDSDMLYWQRYNFINTDAYAGLTETVRYKAERILNGIRT